MVSPSEDFLCLFHCMLFILKKILFCFRANLTIPSSTPFSSILNRMAKNTSNYQVVTDDTSISALIQNDGISNVKLLLNDRVHTNEGKTSITSLLLSAPLEIRHQIYIHFLKCDETRRLPKAESLKPFNFKILSICQQVRREAWQYFCTSNRWIQHASYGIQELDTPYYVRQPGSFEVPLHRFPQHEMAALNSSITLTVRAGRGCGLKKSTRRKPVDRFIFAYNKPNWIEYCMDLLLNPFDPH